MKPACILASLACFIQYAFSTNLENEWTNFQEKFGKSYRSIAETRTRFGIFANNLEKIEDHNKRFENGEVSFMKGVNKFADWTTEEFLDYVNRNRIAAEEDRVNVQKFKAEKNISIDDSVDWRTKGCITEVKDQGNCGSCWSFSTTGSLEAQLFLKKGKLISLSEQNLMDCSWGYENWGCSGGVMRRAFDYITLNGIESEADYPYEQFDGRCRFNKTKSIVSISGYVSISKDEDSLMTAVSAFGPLSVAIDATDELQFYSSGILQDTTCSSYAMNHGVLLVGYGSEDGKNYYIIKNSWGAAWGEEGFFRLGNRGSNPCGVMNDACYPKVI